MKHYETDRLYRTWVRGICRKKLLILSRSWTLPTHEDEGQLASMCLGDDLVDNHIKFIHDMLGDDVFFLGNVDNNHTIMWGLIFCWSQSGRWRRLSIWHRKRGSQAKQFMMDVC